MLKKFCPRCAKVTSNLFDGICSDCYLETKTIVEAPQNVRVLLCRCGRSNEKRTWVLNESMKGMIERIVGMNLKTDNGTCIRIVYEPFVINGKTKVPIMIHAEKSIDDSLIEKCVNLNLVIVPQTCDVCSRVSGGYYEAIIQIRGPKCRQDQILELVKDKVKLYKETDKYSFITQVQVSKVGIDVYLGSIKIAQKIELESKRIYNVTSKITHSVQGVKDGKTIKRMTILLRVSD